MASLTPALVGKPASVSHTPSAQRAAQTSPDITTALQAMRLQDDFLAVLPNLRAFAISLSGDVERADDLVHDTVVRALTHLDKFALGTNLQAWMFTILRNQFHSNYRKRRREVEDIDGQFAAKLAMPPAQEPQLEFENLPLALAKLSAEQREAILLVGAEGFTYEEAARICRTRVGTVKSRVNRARARLAELIGCSTISEIGLDGPMRTALAGA